jgi:hypothetical protein
MLDFPRNNFAGMTKQGHLYFLSGHQLKRYKKTSNIIPNINAMVINTQLHNSYEKKFIAYFNSVYFYLR